MTTQAYLWRVLVHSAAAVPVTVVVVLVEFECESLGNRSIPVCLSAQPTVVVGDAAVILAWHVQ